MQLNCNGYLWGEYLAVALLSLGATVPATRLDHSREIMATKEVIAA